jgi:COP9 signalosome complex subunit 1
MGNEDLGRHYESIGDYLSAQEAFSRMRADVSISKHVVDVAKHLIRVAIEQKNWLAVTSNVAKIRAMQLTPEDEKATQPYLCVASGLVALANNEFREAALIFLQTDASMGSSLNYLVSPNDVAIYGGLCALATMDRKEMQSLVLDNSNFRNFLELEPHVRRAINFFINCKYSSCLSILDAYRSDYELDIYLQKHVAELYRRIRSKSIVQYFIPFSVVTIQSLDEIFGVPGKPIMLELLDMIKSGALDARINMTEMVSHNILSFLAPYKLYKD